MYKHSLAWIAGAVSFFLFACNNSGETTATADTTNTTTATNTGNYAARADSFRINSEAGHYLNPRTGKPLRLSMDVSTGAVTDAETGEPVWRYIDVRDWRVYGGDDWMPLGEARMDNNRITFRDSGDQWVDYNVRWQDEDIRMQEDWKRKYGDTKIKIGKDGDIKIKDEKGKVKYDADDKKIKVDTSR